MKTTGFIFILLMFLFLAFCSTDKKSDRSEKRGKVITSNDFDSTRYANYLDSIGDERKCADTAIFVGINYILCPWDEDKQDTTGEKLTFRPGCFPKSFKFGVGQNDSDFVYYQLTGSGAPFDATIIGFPGHPGWPHGD